ncbi:MAG: 3-hydroxyacyl-CoA dehydrogenase NAD-binding domain-containing protein, partial [Alphaproteobacteria bacterium]
MSIKKIGVIGAGQMGSGISHVAALAGIDVVMSDISQEQLDKAMATIDRNLERQVQRDRINSVIKQDA